MPRAEELAREAEGCLSCDGAGLRCVEVCPNRANIALPVNEGGGFIQGLQIVHIDELCNDCGACGFLCPYQVAALPYKDKPTLFATESAFLESANHGFLWRERTLLLRVAGATLRFSDEGHDPVGHALVAAGTDSGHERPLRMMYALARTVAADHSYLLGEIE